MSGAAAGPRLEAQGMFKSYGGVAAVRDVSIAIGRGEVHALVGENGAGKSTLIGILSGARSADAGAMSLDGEPFAPSGPKEALEAGIGTVYQDPQIVAGMSVAENIFLGRFETAHGVMRSRQMVAEARRLIDALELDLLPQSSCGKLSVAEKQLVQIARAASYDTLRLLILDEPTSSLTPSEADVLFSLVLRLRDRGVSVLFVTHRLEEVIEHADRITVLRDGHHVATVDKPEVSIDDLVRHMVGRDVPAGRSPVRGGSRGGEVALSVRGLGGARYRDVSFDVHVGEIFGMFGLVGSGRTEVLRGIFGADRPTAGKIHIAGRPYEPKSVRHAIRSGLALVPEDRKGQGLVANLSVSENLMLATSARHTRIGFVGRRAHRRVTDQYTRELGIRMAGPDAPVASLSGGNQQKVVIARWLATRPRVLLLDEPAAGIDVGAKAEVYRLVESIAAEGTPVVVVSSELPEILRLSDRIAVMHEGRLTGVLDRDEATEERLVGLASLGVEAMAA
jgi:ABC-type sugar transport system ATPase subunit